MTVPAGSPTDLVIPIACGVLLVLVVWSLAVYLIRLEAQIMAREFAKALRELDDDSAMPERFVKLARKR